MGGSLTQGPKASSIYGNSWVISVQLAHGAVVVTTYQPHQKTFQYQTKSVSVQNAKDLASDESVCSAMLLRRKVKWKGHPSKDVSNHQTEWNWNGTGILNCYTVGRVWLREL